MKTKLQNKLLLRQCFVLYMLQIAHTKGVACIHLANDNFKCLVWLLCRCPNPRQTLVASLVEKAQSAGVGCLIEFCAQTIRAIKAENVNF